jgi:hypothetical protein
VDVLGDEPLARARLTRAQDVELGRGNALELREQLSHDRSDAIDRPKVILGGYGDLDIADVREMHRAVPHLEALTDSEPDLPNVHVVEPGAVLAATVSEHAPILPDV